MAVNDYTDKGFITKYGGGILVVREVLDTGLPKTFTITGITQANPAVVTVSDTTGLVNGDSAIIEAVGGMTQVNDTIFTVANLSDGAPGTFELSGINSSAYGAYTSGGTAKLANTYKFGYLETTTPKYEKPKEDINDETGNTIKSLMGNASVQLTGVFMQSGANILDFLRDSTEAKFYNVYYKMTPTGDLNGITQEFFGALGVFTPKFEIVSGTRRTPFEITFLKNDAAIVIGEPDVIFGSVITTDVTIALGKYYEITET
jgi:hypothetical protein